MVRGSWFVIRGEKMQDFTKLRVWKDSLNLTKEIYRLSDSFPKSEMYGMVSQIRRASVSIMSNISEGAGLDSAVNFCRFLKISYGSANEVKSLLWIAKELNFISENDRIAIDKKVNDIQKMLKGLILKVSNGSEFNSSRTNHEPRTTNHDLQQ